MISAGFIGLYQHRGGSGVISAPGADITRRYPQTETVYVRLCAVCWGRWGI